jgi:hypothetical protein
MADELVHELTKARRVGMHRLGAIGTVLSADSGAAAAAIRNIRNSKVGSHDNSQSYEFNSIAYVVPISQPR